MKFATLLLKGAACAGVVRQGDFFALKDLDPRLPDNMLALIEGYEQLRPLIDKGLESAAPTCAMAGATYLSPLPTPRSFRDFMAYAEHFETCSTKFSRPIPQTYYEIPVFYFSNHNSFRGSGEAVTGPVRSKAMDFEFEIAAIIGRQGSDIPREKAGEHIFGFSILNDWSARDLQMEEISVGLGPAKAKDFATSLGPVIVTKDEFDAYLCGDDPTRYNCATKLTLNGRLLRENNTSTCLYSFADLIARSSQDVALYPGEVIGSGTIGGGTIMEYPQEEVPYLAPGDRVEMEVAGIGTLVGLVK